MWEENRFVGAGVVWSGEGTFASPSSCPCARVPLPARATQASPPRTTLPPPLRVRSGFPGDIMKYLPVKDPDSPPDNTHDDGGWHCGETRCGERDYRHPGISEPDAQRES